MPSPRLPDHRVSSPNYPDHGVALDVLVSVLVFLKGIILPARDLQSPGFQRQTGDEPSFFVENIMDKTPVLRFFPGHDEEMTCVAREESPKSGMLFGELKWHRAVFGLLKSLP